MAGITGKVVSGTGRGAHFMSLSGYKKRLKEALGFTPYPGTLNLEADLVMAHAFLNNKHKLIINRFTEAEQAYGGLDLYLVDVKGLKGAVIVPHMTSHPETIVEVIAPMSLRTLFSLSDGDEVTIR